MPMPAVSARALAATAAAVAIALNAGAALARPQPAGAQGAHRAGVVVRFGDGRLVTRCVSFSEETITGYDLLRRAGLPVAAQISGLGAAVCGIGDEGCAYPAQGCFCQCEDPARRCAYWIYGQWSGGAWRYSGLGALARQVTDGQIDGWVWDVGASDSAPVRLPPVSVEQICAPGATATAAPSRAPASPPATTAAPTRAAPTPPAPDPATRSPDITRAPTQAAAPATALAPTETITQATAPAPSPATSVAMMTIQPAPQALPPTEPEVSASVPGWIGFAGLMAGLGVAYGVARQMGRKRP